jgi:hypothetical protein
VVDFDDLAVLVSLLQAALDQQSVKVIGDRGDPDAVLVHASYIN